MAGPAPKPTQVSDYVKNWRRKSPKDSMAPLITLCDGRLYDQIDVETLPGTEMVILCDTQTAPVKQTPLGLSAAEKKLVAHNVRSVNARRMQAEGMPSGGWVVDTRSKGCSCPYSRKRGLCCHIIAACIQGGVACPGITMHTRRFVRPNHSHYVLGAASSEESDGSPSDDISLDTRSQSATDTGSRINDTADGTDGLYSTEHCLTPPASPAPSSVSVASTTSLASTGTLVLEDEPDLQAFADTAPTGIQDDRRDDMPPEFLHGDVVGGARVDAVATEEAEAPSTLDGRVRSCAVVLGGDTPEVQLLHRVVMAPLTLQRTGEEAVQTALGVEYYQQRATPGGRITAKATNITPTGRGSWGSPGIFASEKVEAWRHVTKAVRDKGGKMFLQLWHTGRIGPPLNQPGGILPVSSSSKLETIHAGKKIVTREERMEPVPLRALETSEIPGIVADYRAAAENAIAAGFYGVELHAANGYLLEQFLHDGINDRTDRYGGSVESRARFLFEAVEAIFESLGSSKVDIRLSPFGSSFGDKDSDPIATYTHVLERLNDYDLAYAHLIEPRGYHVRNPMAPEKGSARQFRETYKGVLSSSGFDRQSAVSIVEDSAADTVAIGRHFISNPDLMWRFQLNKPLNDFNADSFYLGDARVYTDYPFLE
ncbi:hypothetical protein PF003_g14342 [Phytophthora fragariae]|nr:hypothetical protein PF003_g14342 [Phytophthora fragariae]